MICTDILIVVGSLLAGQTSSLAAAERAPSDLAVKVKQLVRQLDDDKLQLRLQAERSLIELGPDVLDLLPNTTARTAAEVKERLGRVRQALQQRSAESATQASRVNLQGEMPLVEALKALEQQTNNRVVGYENRGGTVDVQFEQTPYWQALDEILDQVGLDINQYGGYTQALVVASRPQNRLPRRGAAQYEGIFRFEVVQVNSVRDLRNPSVNAARLTLEVGWEPRTLPITLSIPTQDIAARDERGQAIAVSSGRNELQYLVQRDIPVAEMIIPLQLPARGATKIATLSGELRALIPGKTVPFEFEEAATARDVSKQIAGVTVTLEQLRSNEELYEARVRVHFEQAANAFESHRLWLHNNKAYLKDGDGKQIMPAGYESFRRVDDEAGVKYFFDIPDGPAGLSFVYETPTALITRSVAFELNDIALP